MIWTIVQTSWRRLKNNRSELILTFVVPIIFFSIFAVIFGSRDSSSTTPKIRAVIATAIEGENPDEILSRTIQTITDDLRQQPALRFNQQEDEGGQLRSYTVSEVAELVKRGMVSAGIILHVGDAGKEIAKVEILTDSYDQVASQVVSSLVQRSVYKGISGSAAERMLGNVSKPPQRISEPVNLPTSSGRSNTPTQTPVGLASPSDVNQASSVSVPPISTVDVLGGEKTNPTIAMYAAGIAVMFLLFSATSNSGSLLDEKENSTLDRLLCSQLNMDQLLMGKWLFLTGIGCLQLLLMFTWGAVVFKIEVLRNWQGAVAMSIVTAGAASSFALLLATLCSSRTQLSWISTIVILSMSALGGSMIPRYLMSESIQNIGLITFNAWALDGFNKVFWRELPLEQIGLELGVLAGCAALFIVLARLFAVRWERT